MNELRVDFGFAARDALCAAFDVARSTIDAEFFSISDSKVIESLNNAAARHVTVNLYVDGNPSRYRGNGACADRPDPSVVDALRKEFPGSVHVHIRSQDVFLHAKAAVVDGKTALIATANPTWSGFRSPGEVLVTDCAPHDVALVEASIAAETLGQASGGDFVVSGPAPAVRASINHLLDSSADLRVASEDLSDWAVIEKLAVRHAQGHHDRVLVNGKVSSSQTQAVAQLRAAGVDVRSLLTTYMHEKYVDDGSEIYVGSANLTRNGLDEAHEIGVVAPAAAFGAGADALRADFDGTWNLATPLLA